MFPITQLESGVIIIIYHEEKKILRTILMRNGEKYKCPYSLTEQNTSLRNCEIKGLNPFTGTRPALKA